MTRLELERRKRNLSQEKLAQQLLYHRNIVGKLESGNLNPNNVHKRLRKALEDHFGLTLEDLLASV